MPMGTARCLSASVVDQWHDLMPTLRERNWKVEGQEAKVVLCHEGLTFLHGYSIPHLVSWQQVLCVHRAGL